MDTNDDQNSYTTIRNSLAKGVDFDYIRGTSSLVGYLQALSEARHEFGGVDFLDFSDLEIPNIAESI